MTSTAQQSVITLKGSTQIVTEFFGFGINNILYQRGVYPPESFTKVQHYGLPLMITAEEGLKKYLNTVLIQLEVLVLTDVDTNEVLERWTFNIETDDKVDENTEKVKDKKEITKEIQALIRQITSSVTFLPLLEGVCSFDLLVYTDKDAQMPKTWEESEPKYISNSSEVRLRSFTTSIHKVDSLVSYKDDSL
eukprot:gene10621-3244_t